MLDINLLRRDLPTRAGCPGARKTPQPYLDVARFSALEAERKRCRPAPKTCRPAATA
jgi:seryl-tRNA synthetase